MRRFDKDKHIEKANQLAEQRYLKSKGLLKEDSYVDSSGRLVGHHSPNEEAASKLAFQELMDGGVPVKEPRWHNSDPTVLFMIDVEEEGSEKFISPFFGTEIAKMEGWKHPKVSDFVRTTLEKYKLWGEFEDNATYNIRA